mmetsp:Transcript_2957/g.2878  ORF Transcript_2957/g.2878 Transcript_2957/m.2878 type:complete len:170 (-) Transcript_2957:55-564(-)
MAKKDSIKKPATHTTGSKIGHPIHELISAVSTTYKDYVNSLTPRLKLIDIFLTFLVLLGVLQFIYVLLVGNFPFNAFLGGFISCVGQFVLTVSLRLQYNYENNSNNNSDKIVQEIEEKDIEDVNETKVDVGILEVNNEKPFKFVTPERAFGDFIFASLILHFIVFHFIN